MTDELVKRYEAVGIVHVPVGEFKRVKTALEVKGYKFHMAWDNGLQYYIFTENEGGSLI